MKENVTCVRFLRLASLLFAGLLTTIASGQTLKEVAKFDLPGPPGKRLDYLAIDADDHYLISAYVAAGQTYVIDLNTNRVVATRPAHATSRLSSACDKPVGSACLASI
jgi:hypothetical protein